MGREVFDVETERLEKERLERERANQARWAAEKKQREQFDLDKAERKKAFEEDQRARPDVSARMAEVRAKAAENRELLRKKKVDSPN
jgi:hypothetical protein